MGEVSAVVLDANIFGKGAIPSIGTIEKLAERCAARDAELWVPEVVAAELAQHAVEKIQGHVENLAAYNSLRRRLSLTVVSAPDPVDPQDIIDAIEQAGAEVVLLDGESARNGILDQTLLRGPAERKSGVKTGGADSAWIRSVIARNGGTADGLLLLTEDVRAVERTCKALGIAMARVVKHLGELGTSVGQEVTEASEDEAQALVEWFGQQHAEQLLDQIGLRTSVWDDAVGKAAGIPDRLELQVREFGEPKASPSGAPLKRDAWTGALVGRVRFVVAVQEQYAGQDQWGDRLECKDVEYLGEFSADVTAFPDEGYAILQDGKLVAPNPSEVYVYDS